MKEIKEKVRKFIGNHALLSEHARVLVGLSGGPDSVCLARMLKELGYEIVVAHCNFHLRGEESMRDERFVRDLCQEQGWTLRNVDFETEAYAQQKSISIEMAAREQRYDWFRKMKKEVGAEAIAVGHHQDDNNETLILNLSRGTGIRGLCGMQPKQNDIVRPLLCLTRQEIVAYLDNIGQAYVTDHTNQEDHYARNKVRLNVMPLLESINKGASGNLASTIENLTEVEKVYLHSIQQSIEACSRHTQEGYLHIIIYILQQQPSPISVLHELLSPLGFNKAQLKDILASLSTCGKVFTANGHKLLIDREEIVVKSDDTPNDNHNCQLSTVNCQLSILPVEEVTFEKSPNYAYLDADKLHGELTLRTPRTGDTFAPFGMGGKRKLLSDYLTDQKLSLFEKERQPLLMDGEEIVWVVGRRSSELYRIDDETKTVVCLHCNHKGF
ncbi:MAG: tRNA lysidine(34) synthetase TilS [Bacteroidaceae bacterium]|nr:tRNA lysidine(34) synthetase TilS [Bacteroidaceae bacterium]